MEKSKNIFAFICCAILVEATITYLNQFFVQGQFAWQMLASIGFGILLAIAYKLDLPEYFDIKSHIPFVGQIITGILISRGANYFYDLIGKITNIS